MSNSNFSRRTFLKHSALGVGALTLASKMAMAAPKSERPNIVFIMADDMGYGDVKALNPDSKIKTPHLDKLRRAGMAFTDAHTSSSVCTPTRYGLLTGRYNWRSRLKKGVLTGYSPPLIEKDRLTVPAMLKKKGYHTACIGKWHLGMDWAQLSAEDANKPEGKLTKGFDLKKSIQNGPNSNGFDYFYGISASLDMPPYVFIENDKALYSKLVTKAFNRKGAADTDFEAIDVLPKITERSVSYINQQAKTGEPFFLYFPLNAPHTPILPAPEWQGKSGLSKYGDFVMQVDWTVGQVMEAIQRNGIVDNTLIIFTADNGCSPAANIPEMQKQDHFPNYIFRGHKADIFDGGHRVPYLARWPKKVKAGSSCEQLTCHTDLMATCADIVDAILPDNAGEDSVSMLSALLGKDKAPLREAVVHHSINGSFSIRQGKWKLELCPGSGGWSDPRPGKATKGLPLIQLYDMKADIRETKNLQAEQPEVVQRLTTLLKKYVADGRSTPGAKQQNNGAVNIRLK